MSPDDLRDLVLRCLAEIAPDADLDGLDGDAPLRETLDLDSMDMFNLVAAISGASGIDVPDRDVPDLRTLDATVDYLVAAGASA